MFAACGRQCTWRHFENIHIHFIYYLTDPLLCAQDFINVKHLALQILSSLKATFLLTIPNNVPNFSETPCVLIYGTFELTPRKEVKWANYWGWSVCVCEPHATSSVTSISSFCLVNLCRSINTLRTGLFNCLNARSRGLNFRYRASCI